MNRRPFPLLPIETGILRLLAHLGPSYGYAMAKRLELDNSTIYRALGRLEARSLIGHSWVADRGPARRVYVISQAGLDTLEPLPPGA